MAIVIVLGGFALTAWRLGELPDLGLQVDAGMVVRGVGSGATGTDPQLVLDRDDRLTALAGHEVRNLPDVISIVRNGRAASDQESASTLSYQAVRPLYRFTVALHGETPAPGMLPPGVEPQDKLVEVDGRALPGKVGAEGIKSIVASRPEAVLGFERTNAVFDGDLRLRSGMAQKVHWLYFPAFLVVILALLRLKSRRSNAVFAAGVGVETALLSLAGVLVFRPLWVQADALLTAMAIVGLVMPRAVAFLARGAMEEEGAGAGPVLSAILACVGAILLSVLAAKGVLASEQALQFAALLGALYTLYELVAGMARQSMRDPGAERGLFVAGVVVLSACAGVFAYLLNPTDFLEEQWLPFSLTVLSLMWFGDAVLVARGPATTGIDEVASHDLRQQRIIDYLEGLERARTQIVLFTAAHSVCVRRAVTGLEFVESDATLHDALTILVHERAQVPAIAASADDPMAGIARAMNIVLATVLGRPEGAVDVPDVVLAVVAFGEADEAPVPLDVVDVAQTSMTPTTWLSIYLEGLPYLGNEQARVPEQPSISPHTVEELRARVAESAAHVSRLQQELEEKVAALRVATSVHTDRSAPLEAELTESLAFLLQTPEPIVIGGPFGAGKCFVALRAAATDARFAGPTLVVDVARLAPQTVPAAEIAAAEGGALILRSSRLLDAHQIRAILHQATACRVYFLFDQPTPDDSVLIRYPEAIVEALEHRELVLPEFRRRAIRREVVEYLVDAAARRHGKEVLGIAAEVWKRLDGHPFHGNVAECVTMIETAVATSGGEILEIGDFPGL